MSDQAPGTYAPEAAMVNAVQPAASEWQPIATAPKGEMVWLFEPHAMGGFMFAGQQFRGGWVNNLDQERQKPTHWMPLPDEPVAP